jgi:CRISPR-associated protein Csd1
MSWIEKLYQTYENNTGAIGSLDDKIPLLPICHSTQNAQITITLDDAGNFVRAAVVPKNDGRTIIPATEDSAGRTSGATPHPLCDKLQYVAADYSAYGGDKNPCHEPYKELLNSWISRDDSQWKLTAIAAYVAKGRVVNDLVAASVLHTEDNGKLIDVWPSEQACPEIFKLFPGGYDNKGNKKPWQADAFVRWCVEKVGNPQPEVWLDQVLWQSWVDYYGNTKDTRSMCFVTGEEVPLAVQHPAKIRNDGDKAKLVSSNDSSGYTFRGRFTSADEACGIGFQVTQKAHSALRWLIARQGRRDGDQAIVAWAVSGADIPDPQADTLAFLFDDERQEELPKNSYTAQEVGSALSRKIAGYSTKLKATDSVVVLGLDSATPGRMAISYYRELTGSEFLERIEAWHTGCCWQQYFGKDKIFYGAPAPRDIAEVAYGRRIDDKLRKATVERLLPCIIDAVAIPRDLVDSCVRRASSRNGIEYWEWEKALGIACALYRKQNEKEGYQMALDEERNSRDYLYGRLLALAENLEHWALNVAGEKRPTNAERMMQRFADHPYSTWRTLELGLVPYKTRLGGRAHKILSLIDTVHGKFNSPEDYTRDDRLSGEFLLGYHCQRAALKPAATQDVADNTDEADDTIL